MKRKNLSLLTSLFLTQATPVWAMEVDDQDRLHVAHQQRLHLIESDWVMVENSQVESRFSIPKENTPYDPEGNLDHFKGLSITEGLDDESVLNLHKVYKFYKANNKNLFEVLGLKITKIILDILGDLGDRDEVENNYLLNLSLVSPEYYKLSGNTIDERKFYKLFNFEILNNEENEYFVQHSHDIVLIAAAYHRLKVEHIAFTLYDILKEHLEKVNVWEQIKCDCLMYFIQEKDCNPHPKELRDRTRRLLTENQDYQTVSSYIKPLRDPEVKEVYMDLRDELVQSIENALLGELNIYKQGGKFSPIPYQAGQNTSTGFFSYFWKYPTLTEEMVKERFKRAHECLTHRDKSARGWTKLNLYLTIHSMGFKNPFELSFKDFILIHQQTLKKKYENATMSDKAFVDQYGDEIFSYKLTNPFYRNKIFYDYEEVIESMRTQNQLLTSKLFCSGTKK